MGQLTHLDEQGKARMVDVGGKNDTKRQAIARGKIFMEPSTMALIREGNMAKGDVLAVARVAGIMGAKQTANLIPMCHPLMLTGIEVDFNFEEGNPAGIQVQTTVRTEGKTGVEMEALTAASVALLTIYDMCKAVDKAMVIDQVRLIQKSGGKSGDFQRQGEKQWSEVKNND